MIAKFSNVYAKIIKIEEQNRSCLQVSNGKEMSTNKDNAQEWMYGWSLECMQHIRGGIRNRNESQKWKNEGEIYSHGASQEQFVEETLFCIIVRVRMEKSMKRKQISCCTMDEAFFMWVCFLSKPPNSPQFFSRKKILIACFFNIPLVLFVSWNLIFAWNIFLPENWETVKVCRS